jgi:glycosyltransferase involved in cell wall biosynthesis
MKIVIFIQSLQGGGAERVSSHLANVWTDMGRDVTVITLTDSESDVYSLHPAVHRISLNLSQESHRLTDALLANSRRIMSLRKFLKQLDVDVVVAMMTTASILAVFASFGLKCRIIISERCYPALTPISRVWLLLRRMAYPLADCVVAQTPEALQWLQKYAGCKDIVVIPNPVVLPLSAGEPNYAPDLILKPAQQLLLAAGRLDKEKGFDLLIQAYARFASQCPQWQLVILGEGPERVALERQVDRLELKGRVYLPGRVGNMPDWYRRADLFVMSSYTEGFPNVLLEAMAHGCAAVSYDCDTGPRNIITDGVNGLLVRPVSSVDALAKALVSLIKDDARRSRMKKNANIVREKFALSEIVSQWERVIN